MMCGVLPPHSSETRLRFDLPEYCMKYLPTSVEPVKATMSTSMCMPIAWPAVSPMPGTTWRTPAGRPASTASWAIRIAVNDDCSAGLRTTELPVASAGPSFHDAIISGKFHGTTAPITPSGSRTTIATADGSVGAISSEILSTASA